jgi:thioesterase domain-containing protein
VGPTPASTPTNGSLPTLRRAFFVGDVLRRDDVARLTALAPAVRVVNYYGSTETQRAVSYHAVAEDPRDEPKEVIPLGRGIPGVQLLVRDAAGGLCGIGEVGEIWLRSPHVAAGYLGDEALTAERFVANPWTGDPADRLYRTGDLGRYRPDGTVEPAGRADQQVKVRGFRVELGEVEAALTAHSAVRQAVVVAREDDPGDARLVAYLIADAPSGATADADALRAHLRELLPVYMVPSAFVALDAFPLTGTGKVDRRALPEPEAVEAAAAYEPPRTEAEATMAEAWAEVLGVSRVGRADDFFALGGHSLLAVRLMARVRERTGREVPLAEMFRSPTLAAFAAAVEGARSGAGGSPLVTLRAEGTRPPLFCVHPAGGTVFRYADLARHLGDDQPVHAFQAVGVADGAEPLETVDAMAARYLDAMREARPHGPYVVAGWSAGGVVALEMARRLRAEGEAVPLLVLFDAIVPRPERVRAAPHDVELYCRYARDLGGAGEARLSALSAALAAVPEDARLGALADWIAREEIPIPDATLEQIARTVRVFRTTVAAVDAHRPAPYDGDALLLVAAEGSPGAGGHGPEALAESWRPLLTGRLAVRTVPGTHAAMMSEPNVRAVAREVAAALDG